MDHFFLKITLGKVIVLCTRLIKVLQVSLLTTVNIFLGFGCEASLSWLMYFQVTSSTDSALNIEASACNLFSFACVQILYMAMRIFKCSDPIFLG